MKLSHRFFLAGLIIGVLAVTLPSAGETAAPSAKETAAVAALFRAAEAIPHLLAPGETPQEWAERVQMIVQANYGAAAEYANGQGWTRFEIALADTVLEGNETRFDRRIHAGEKHPIWTQDDGLATCLGQHHESKNVPREEWQRLAGLGLEATERCARATTMVLVSQAKQCGVFLGRRASKGAVAAAFAGYGSGGNCSPSEEMSRRGAEWERLMGKFGPKQKPDVPGFRRALPQEIPQKVRDEAFSLKESEDFRVGLVRRMAFGDPPRTWAFKVEKHAEGKIGVSVFVAER